MWTKQNKIFIWYNLEQEKYSKGEIINEEKIINRGIKRGDNIEALKERLASERDEFNHFRDDIGADGWFNYNFLIYNDTLDNLYKGLDNIADIYDFKPINNEKKLNDVEEDIELC